MAPKKDTAAAPDAVPAAPATKKAAAPKKAPAPRKPKVVPAEGAEKKPRSMSACSSEFVASVQASLPAELQEKLKVKEVKEICETFVKTLVNNVLGGTNVNFTNHMSFTRRARAARVYKNLKTKESITKPRHYVMTMAVKPNLKKQFDEIEVVDPPPKA